MQVMVEYDARGRYTVSQDGVPFAPGPGPLPAPPILFLGSFGACAGAFAVKYLETRGLPFAGLKVTVSAQFAENPHRIGYLDYKVTTPQALPERHVKAMARAVELCTIKQSFAVTPEFTSAIVASESAEDSERMEPAEASTTER